MPNAVARLRLLVASAALVVAGAGLLALAPVSAPPALAVSPSPATTASSAPTTPPPSDPPTPPCVLAICRTSSPTPKASASPTRSATPKPTVSPTPRRTHRPTYAPTAQATFSEAPITDTSPVTDSISVGPATGTLAPDVTPSVHPAASATRKVSDPISRLVTLVLGAAVLLGVGGATGLYLTRNPHEH